jgi:hypothetical protein
MAIDFTKSIRASPQSPIVNDLMFIAVVIRISTLGISLLTLYLEPKELINVHKRGQIGLVR